MPPISLPLRFNVLRVMFFPMAAMIAAPDKSLTPAFLMTREERLPGRAKMAQSISDDLGFHQFANQRASFMNSAVCLCDHRLVRGVRTCRLRASRLKVLQDRMKA